MFILSFVSGLIGALWSRRHIRVIQLDSLLESIVWTFRSWREGYPASNDPNHWDFTDAINEDQKIYIAQVRGGIRAWTFLGPFFASRGYTLYDSSPKSFMYLVPPTVPQAYESPSYPYSRRGYKEDSEIPFPIFSIRCWAARDSQGRELVIRLVSGPSPSDELKILHRLNTKEARADPRNHTIYALDFVTYDGLVFVVMPRWPAHALSHDFGIVAELIHFTDVILESFVFLHENRVAHLDFLGSNMGINVMVRDLSNTLKGMRNRATVRYALYDFGVSMIFPCDMVLNSPDARAPGPHAINFPLRQLPYPSNPDVNPFEVDLLFFKAIMERRVRHIESIVPEIGPFFDSLVSEDNRAQMSFHQALTEFRGICSRLTDLQMSSEITTMFWTNGVVKSKSGHLIFYAEPDDNAMALSIMGEEN